MDDEIAGAERGLERSPRPRTLALALTLSAGLLLPRIDAQEPGTASGLDSGPGPAATSRPPSPTPSLPEAGPRIGGAPFEAIDRIREVVPFSSLVLPRSNTPASPPGMPSRAGRPRPGSLFDPGAAGPGISRSGGETFLDGALDSKTGWPFVFLDHFKPRPEHIERLWIVRSRERGRGIEDDPWTGLKAYRFDDEGNLVERSFDELYERTLGRPVLVQIQGNLTTLDIAIGGLLWTDSWLRYRRALPEDAVVIAFDWPSQRVSRFDAMDVNLKARRSFDAAQHLAAFVQGFAPESRICLLGQSFGARVVPAALHLLGGGGLAAPGTKKLVRLSEVRRDLHVRAVLIGAATDRHWLNPGERLDRALLGCESMLNLYNRRDEALILYPFLISSGRHAALGRVGLSNRDFQRLGELAARYEEQDIHDILGPEHTLLDAVANPRIARRIAPYTWSPDPGPPPPEWEAAEAEARSARGGLFNGLRSLFRGRLDSGALEQDGG